MGNKGSSPFKVCGSSVKKEPKLPPGFDDETDTVLFLRFEFSSRHYIRNWILISCKETKTNILTKRIMIESSKNILYLKNGLNKVPMLNLSLSILSRGKSSNHSNHLDCFFLRSKLISFLDGKKQR